jgi:hypothetical protein
MDPLFKRLVPPNTVVVEMRTKETRTFGFFARINTFVAVFLAETNTLKAIRNTDPYKEYATKIRAVLGRISDADIDRITNVETLVTDRFPRR